MRYIQKIYDLFHFNIIIFIIIAIIIILYILNNRRIIIISFLGANINGNKYLMSEERIKYLKLFINGKKHKIKKNPLKYIVYRKRPFIIYLEDNDSKILIKHLDGVEHVQYIEFLIEDDKNPL